MSHHHSSSNSDTLMVAQYLSGRDYHRAFPSRYGSDDGRSSGKPPNIYIVQGPARIETGPARSQTKSQAWRFPLSLASCVLMLWIGYHLGPYNGQPGVMNAGEATAGDQKSSKTYYVAPHPPVFDVFPTVSYPDGVAMDTFALMNESTTALGEMLVSSLQELGFRPSPSEKYSEKEVAKLPENLRRLGQLTDLSLKRSLLHTQWLQTQCRITPSSRWITEAEQHRSDAGHHEPLPWWCASRRLPPLEACQDAAAKAYLDVETRLSTLRTSLGRASSLATIVAGDVARSKVAQTIEAAREQTCGQANRLARLLDGLARAVAVWQQRHRGVAHRTVRITPSVQHTGRDGVVPEAWYLIAHNKTDLPERGADLRVRVEHLDELQTTALAMAARGRRMCSAAQKVEEQLGVALWEKIPAYQKFLEIETGLVTEWQQRLKEEGYSGFQGPAGIELADWFEAQIAISSLRWEKAIEGFH
ncbi:hypothetical protein PpBr36_03533 [Pyricularia pennisetigena]|uniref:hypothetical protein n=1 Tax=Pyricularia pennisetigena TaxID=1578925 RepID=UPI0011533C89|nr:hypothetical protein PpBr36_03533 [Pyricularia pennisetigena]TLS30831.1 hypothetical protein PpBr36_03533 [Pyricularia pennisetigena]